MRIVFAFLAVFFINHNALASDFLTDDLKEKLEKLYVERLDKWVAGGGDVNSIQEQVVTNCGKLFYMHVDPKKIPNLSKEEREHYDDLIDMCVKITVTRIEVQPEFEKPEVIQLVCTDVASNYPIFVKLCQKAKLATVE